MSCEGLDQYQVMIDGSRRLTRKNRRYLRLFTPFQPHMTVPCRQAGAVKPAATVPNRTSDNGDTAEERDQLRFVAIITSNSQQCPSMKNMGVMSTNLWGIVQHEAQ